MKRGSKVCTLEELQISETGKADSPDIVDYQHPIASASQSRTVIEQIRISLPNLAKACDRTGVSDRSAAIIASVVSEDLQLTHQE
ncbi:hypothetical protein ILUMI_17705 [Ignelater luminosus]|uniref:Uncharacterized protein n=1 Tax=Ignelater luminosus TaxID=2038154 RepID=A0A8K0CPZ6_IGNLU|nr:hypothetical protein ILUMI_17705 [Ignelater luminosus]